MSIEHDQSTRKAMRAGISGENVLRPLDEFTVTECLQAGEQEKRDATNRKTMEDFACVVWILSACVFG